ncbi:MAG: LSU ribosomal protein L4p (L1e) [uncultured Thermomicrobiales bacterium]|uniref:Large ribosomal subunit protein uL4 n=1 Tax=uncultured Thermomicrobiales bacterium TaxID=1645740 RepID=A0A6J4UW83_9BACT|nr:MAG: LSU ribosomal protein L4p (L1e) [uncultured Thermomicrobiales bacterium]
MAMMVNIVDATGAVVGRAELDETVWGVEPHIAVMHQALLRQLANARKGTHKTKTRGFVSGGGKKPYRQKGTGRARQGSTRAPQWKGGGVVWGPQPRDYTQAMPRKMRRLAIRSALSAKLRDQRLTVVRGLSEIEPRTKAMRGVLATLPQSRSMLIAVPDKEGAEAIYRSANNLPEVHVITAPMLNVRDVLKYDRLVIMEEAVAVVEGLWALQGAARVPGRFRKARLARLRRRQGNILAAKGARVAREQVS